VITISGMSLTQIVVAIGNLGTAAYGLVAQVKTCAVACPRPAELVWGETNVSAGSSELPFPEPIPFSVDAAHEPVNALQPSRNRRDHIIQSHYD
jgi:hypothetical protein